MNVTNVTIDVGQNAVINVTVPVNATGFVHLTIGNETYAVKVNDGKGSIAIKDLTSGVKAINVTYMGDDQYLASNSTGKVTVSKLPSTVSVSVDNIAVGDKAVIKITVPGDATGNVTTVVIGDKTYYVPVANGTGILIVDGLKVGNYTVKVTYNGDDKYNVSAQNETVFSVDKINVTDDEIKVIDQGNGTVVVVVGGNATGNVTITLENGTNFTAPVINGTAAVNLTNVTPGEQNITVIYSGDDTHTNATVNGTVNIPKLTPTIKVDVTNIYVGDKALINVTLPKDATGGVTIEINGKVYIPVEFVDGVARFEVENLTFGNKTVAVNYSGDSNYTGISTTANFTVYKRNSTVKAEVESTSAGENVTITVTVPSDATGQVLIDINGTNYYVNLTKGTGSITIPDVKGGNYAVNLTYVGDDRYLGSSNKTTFSVSKSKPFVIPTAHDIYVGDIETISLSLPADATGNVTVVIDGEEYTFTLNEGTLGAAYKEGEKYTVAISGGKGELVITGLPKGEYTVSVKYNGDDKYLQVSNTTTFKVLKRNTTMDVIDQGNGTVIVKLPENATGNVTIVVDGKTYVENVTNGTAVFNLDDLTPGDKNITVTYSGDDNYNGDDANATISLPKSYAPISVTAHDIYVGETEKVVVSLPKSATGTVTIEINGKEYTAKVINGKATFNVKGLAFGEKTVAVKYSGDKNYRDNYTTGQFTVFKVPSTVKAKGSNINVGKDEIITATVPSDATGRVLVNINGIGYYATISKGKAKVVIPELPSGKYTATVIYEGDNKYLSSKTTVQFTVKKVNTPIKADGDSINYGENATVVVHVPTDATGNITINVNGKEYATEVKNGKAVFSVSGLAKGDYGVTAKYSGDKKYEANDTLTDIDVYFHESKDHDDGNSTERNRSNSENEHISANHQEPLGQGVSLTQHATGNPILLILLIVLCAGVAQLRRFK